jgi:hypothetical protein
MLKLLFRLKLYQVFLDRVTISAQQDMSGHFILLPLLLCRPILLAQATHKTPADQEIYCADVAQPSPEAHTCGDALRPARSSK